MPSSLTAKDEQRLRRAMDLAREASRAGNGAFGAVIVAADGRVLAESRNTVATAGDPTGHAESNAIRQAAAQHGKDSMDGATLYASTEPCAMCAGAIYWARIARVVFALREHRMVELLRERGMTRLIDHPCRAVFDSTTAEIQIEGPFLEEEALQIHKDHFASKGSS